MKKVLFILMMLVTLPLTTQAQKAEHLSFLGIPINGTLKGFITQLERKGFKQTIANDGTLFHEGKYLGENVLVQVVTKKNVVGMINVLSQDGYDQENVVLRMTEFEKELSKLYGTKFRTAQQKDQADIYKNGKLIGFIGVGGIYMESGFYCPLITFMDKSNFGK